MLIPGVAITLSASAVLGEGAAPPEVIEKEIYEVAESQSYKEEEKHATEKEDGQGCCSEQDNNERFHGAPPERR